MINSTQRALFWIFRKFYCVHPTEYVAWENNEWESWEICTICYYNNLYSNLKHKLEVWLLKKNLGMVKKQI